MAGAERRLGVIMCAGFVEDGPPARLDEAQAIDMLSARREAVTPLLIADGGHIVKTGSRRLVVEFPSAFHALRAAYGVQRRLAELNAAALAGPRFALRIGIAIGDVLAQQNELLGNAIALAERLQDRAEPGGISVSQAVQAALHQNIDAMFRDGGNVALSDLASPVHVYNLALEASAGLPPKPAVPPGPSLLSLIVVPFVNLSGEARHDDFVEGVTDQLTGELARIENSFVVPRAMALAYRAFDLSEMGQEAGVRFAVIGRLRVGVNGLDIDIEILDTSDPRRLWSDRFNVGFADPPTMHRSVGVGVIPPVRAQLLIAAGRMAPGGSDAPPRTIIPAETGTAPAEDPGQVEPPTDFPIPPIIAPTRDAALENSVATAPITPRPAPQVAFRPAPGRPAQAQASISTPVRTWHISFWQGLALKLAITLAVGIVALAILGGERSSLVEIVSCMLVTAGIVQVVAVIASRPRS